MEKNMIILGGMRAGYQSRYPVCLHVEEGLIQTPKLCISDYECCHCGFDQWLEEMERSLTKDESLKVAGPVLARAA